MYQQTPTETQNPSRPEIHDTLFFILRAVFFIGAAAWAVAIVTHGGALPAATTRMPADIAPILLWFFLYTAFFYLLVRKFPFYKPVSYHVMMILDTVFVTLTIYYTGQGASNFYLAYNLFIAAYTLSFGALSGAVITIFSAIFYLALYMLNPDKYFAADFGARLSFMFLVFFVVAVMTEQEKRDRRRNALDKEKIDELNRRLEKSFADLMEEKETITATNHEKTVMLRKQAEITERRRSHIAFSKELNSKNNIEETVLLFARYLCSLLDVDGAALILTEQESRSAELLLPADKRVSEKRIDFHHPILESIRKSHEHEIELTAQALEKPDVAGAIAEILPEGFKPAVVRAASIISGKPDAVGVFVIHHSAPCEFDAELMEEISILSNHLGVAVQNLRYRMKLQALADTDGLTGIFNHRYFQEQLDRELARTARYDRPLSLMLFDIDHFKKMNDTHGHPAGDAVLRELSRKIRGLLRNVDVFARYGGEEFVIILPETAVEGAAILADRLRKAVEQHDFPTGGGEHVKITISIGLGAYPDRKEKQDLINAADQALYRAKQGGRNRVEA